MGRLAFQTFHMYGPVTFNPEPANMVMKFIGGMMPLFILCCLLATFIAADIQGLPVSWMLFMLNGAGIILALFHGLEFRV
jgi:hypothetical protein